MLRSLTLGTALLLAAFSSALTFAIEDQRPETCGNANGSVSVFAYGGQPPYTFDWTGPSGFTATGSQLTGLAGGDYSLTLTDNLGAIVSGTITIESLSQLTWNGGPTWAGAAQVTGYWGGACIGECNGAGAFVDYISGGTPPFFYFFDVPATFLGYNDNNDPVYGGFCLGEWVNYTYTDALGCPGYGDFIVYGVDESWTPTVQEVQGACTGGQNGSMSLENTPFFSVMITLMHNGQYVASQTGGPGGTLTFTGLEAGLYQVLADFEGTQCAIAQDVTVPDLGPDCGPIAGMSWYDVDGDCVHDANEVGVPNSVLEVQPGGYYAITHADGGYSLNLPAGNYTLAQLDASLVPNCPANMPAPFTIDGNGASIDLANSSTAPLDLRIHAAHGAARPGFAYQQWTNVSNLSPQLSGPVTVTCTYDAALTYQSASPPPLSVVGNTLTWSLAAFNSFGGAAISLQLLVPSPTPLGTQLSSTWSVSNTLPDGNLGNNTHTITRQVTGSYDPNVKEAATSSGQSDTQYLIGTDAWIDYTIRFQNTGSDTAFTVVVTDTLPAELDMATFQQGSASYPFTVDFLTGRVVRWTFTEILLVDSTTNEPLSHGLTSFRIRLHEPVLPGTLISNNADIFFDFNEPVRTPDAMLITEMSTGLDAARHDALQVVPNPAQDRITLLGTGSFTRVRIATMDGRTALEQILNSGQRTVDIEALAVGCYVAEAVDAHGAKSAVRLVKR